MTNRAAHPRLKDQQFLDRVAEVAREESEIPEHWCYLSFADEKFLGAVLLKARGTLDASMKAHALGINPGGEMLCIPIPPNAALPDEQWHNRLLTKEQVVQLWPDAKHLREMEEER